MNRARILLADDHCEMRNTVEQLLESEFEIVGAVENGRELLEAESETKPDVCILDISMPIMSGIHAANQLSVEGSQARIIFLTVHEDPDLLRAALDTGALGYVLKSRIVSDLSQAIKDVVSGRVFISPSKKLGTHSSHK